MLDSASLGSCAGALLLYNVLALALRMTSGLTMMLQTGRAWTQKHMSGRSAPDVTLAVQTLRNTVLVATFVGTLSFTVTASTLSAAAASEDAPSRTRALLQAALLTGSFLNFALVIRSAAHSGYLIGTASGAAPAGASEALPLPLPLHHRSTEEEGASSHSSQDSPAELFTLLQMQAVHFSLGFRFLYCSIPFAFAVVGAEALIAATCCILIFLAYIDNALSVWGWCSRQ
jgi:hypothetical protein